MPVHAREKKESNHEEMEVDFAEQDGSSSEDEETETSSVSEDGESSGKHQQQVCSNAAIFVLIMLHKVTSRHSSLIHSFFNKCLSLQKWMMKTVKGEEWSALTKWAILKNNSLTSKTSMYPIYYTHTMLCICIFHHVHLYHQVIQRAPDSGWCQTPGSDVRKSPWVPGASCHTSGEYAN